MLKLIKTNTALAIVIFVMATALNACGEKTMIPNSKIHSFDHKLPESLSENPNFSSDEFKPFMDEDILFWGGARGKPDANTFDIGVQFNTKTEGRKIFIEKMILETPDLMTERFINEFVDIDLYHKSTETYYKRLAPFEKISGDSIPLNADFFMLKIDYKLDDGPTKQKSIRFDNASFLAPDL